MTTIRQECKFLSRRGSIKANPNRRLLTGERIKSLLYAGITLAPVIDVIINHNDILSIEWQRILDCRGWVDGLMLA